VSAATRSDVLRERLRVDAEFRQEVIDALGLEQVGWGCVIEGRMALSSVRVNRPTHAGADFYEPIYRLRVQERSQ